MVRYAVDGRVEYLAVQQMFLVTAASGGGRVRWIFGDGCCWRGVGGLRGPHVISDVAFAQVQAMSATTVDMNVVRERSEYNTIQYQTIPIRAVPMLSHCMEHTFGGKILGK